MLNKSETSRKSIQEHDVKTTKDIQYMLKDLLDGTIQEMDTKSSSICGYSPSL